MSTWASRAAPLSCSASRAASASRSIGARASLAGTRCDVWPTPTITGARGSVIRELILQPTLQARVLELRLGQHRPLRFGRRRAVAADRAVPALAACVD